MNAEVVGDLQVRLQQTAPISLAAEFACAAGELLALVGPSGSGKSTILRCIAGLNHSRFGKVSCSGATWSDTDTGVNLAPQRRRIGFVFQNYALFPHQTAVGNVMTALSAMTRNQQQERARELLALVGLEGLESRRPAELSGGQQQRVALARALARDPSVLLLDEPFSAVDQVTRRKLHRELARLRRQVDVPIVLVTHDLEEARMLADRMSILHKGETLQTGTPEEVMARPQDARVARMVNLTNVFHGRVVAHDQDKAITRLQWLEYTLECRYQEEFKPGIVVDWVVPPQHVILHQRVRPSRGERENPVRGVIEDFVILGENVSITMLVDGQAGTPLSLGVPTHVARRNSLAPGERISVTLLSEGIHLMEPHGKGASEDVGESWR